MRLATDVDKLTIESIVNDPRLRSWYTDDAPPCNADRFLTSPSFVVIGDEGCFLAHAIDGCADRHVVHTNLLPHCRGAQAIRVAHEALRVAFIKTGTRELVSMVPDNIPHALWMARTMGMRVLFRREAVFPWRGSRWGMTFVAITIDEWILTGACRDAGEGFHRRLGAHQTHGADPVHDAYVGAALRMIQSGRVRKGVDVYNRFARFALYEPIAVLSDDPLRIDIRECVLRVEGGDFNVEVNHA